MIRASEILPAIAILCACLTILSHDAGAADRDTGKYANACEAYNRGDYYTAFEDLMPFAVRGDAPSQFAIAEMLRSGNGTKRNPAEALIWYRRAAEQGHDAAQCNLGTSLYYGWGTAPAPQEAIDWWLHAAIGGNARAMFNLGTVVAKGVHVTRDFTCAYRWMIQAEASGYAPARNAMETLSRVMSPRQLEAAVALSLDDALDYTQTNRRRTPPRKAVK